MKLFFRISDKDICIKCIENEPSSIVISHNPDDFITSNKEYGNNAYLEDVIVNSVYVISPSFYAEEKESKWN